MSSVTTTLDGSRQEQLVSLLNELAEGERKWAATGLAERAKLLRETMLAVAGAADDWVSVACQIKELDADSRHVAEELTAGPHITLRGHDAAAEMLEQMAD